MVNGLLCDSTSQNPCRHRLLDMRFVLFCFIILKNVYVVLTTEKRIPLVGYPLFLADISSPHHFVVTLRQSRDRFYSYDLFHIIVHTHKLFYPCLVILSVSILIYLRLKRSCIIVVTYPKPVMPVSLCPR